MTLKIDTKTREPKKLLLDGEEFHLLGLDHISPDAEDEVTALFAQYGRLARRIEIERKQDVGKKIAAKLRQIRADILGLLTDIPESLIESLKPTVQVQILEALQQLVEGEDDELEPEEDTQDEDSPGADIDAI